VEHPNFSVPDINPLFFLKFLWYNSSMKAIAGRIRKILSMILSVSAASLILPACPMAAYGMPPPPDTIEGTVLSKETRGPIFGIEVSLEGTEYLIRTRTRKDGYFNLGVKLPLQDDYILKFEDVDGDANGGLFKEETLPIRQNGTYYYMFIEMELDTPTQGQ
jgi:hypothetical protein